MTKANNAITGYTVEDLRWPTSLTGDGTDAMNKDCDYSAAYVTLTTASGLQGFGMTFTIGRGNEIVCMAVERVAARLVGLDVETLFSDMGKAWDHLVADAQLRWIGPEKGVISIATGAVVNALWDMYARARSKPLWQLICEMTPEEIVKSTSFRYISDVLSPQEALEMLKQKEEGRQNRIETVIKQGYPAYTTSVGWMGYDDAKVEHLTKDAIKHGFRHFKLKVGASVEDDIRRLRLVRSIIDDPKNFEGLPNPPASTLEGKNAGPTGCVLMTDANQVWDVEEAVKYMQHLAEFKPWFIEEPTAPEYHHPVKRKHVLLADPNRSSAGHAKIRSELKNLSIGVATGEHAHNRMVFKQLLQSQAIDVCQIDSCRLAGINEILAVLLMAAKFGVIVCPHAGGVGLCEYVQHLSIIDYVRISGSMDRNVLEWVDHLHEHFKYPAKITQDGRYSVPMNPAEGYSIEFFEDSKKQFSYPDGSYWRERLEHEKELKGVKGMNGVTGAGAANGVPA